MCYHRTLVNAWTTSYICHEAVLHPCLFGCRCAGAVDRLKHYLVCPRRWRAVDSAGVGASGSSVLEKWSLINPSPESLARVVVAHHVYHSLQQDKIDLALIAIERQGLR